MKKPFDISFGAHNPFRKGEILKSGSVDTQLLVVKVYDHIWWRKLLIKCKILKPIYLTKVTCIHD